MQRFLVKQVLDTLINFRRVQQFRNLYVICM